MTLLAGQTIRRRVHNFRKRRARADVHTAEAMVPGVGELIIRPFDERGRACGRSYGLSCNGYDVRLNEGMLLWPLFGRLGCIMEYVHMPPDLAAEVKDKSTNARKFITVQNTIVEAGWKGYLTIELTRHLPWPVYIKKGTPIAQLVFHPLDEPAEKPYGEGDKYYDQPSHPVKAIMED